MKTPLLTIAITTFDRKELLIETISSVLYESNVDIEIIVGNDNTSRIVDEVYTGIKDARIKYINNEQNLGEWPNLQNLFDVSTGYYFTSLADDDLYHKNFLKEIQFIIQKYNFPECIYTSFTEFEDDFNQEFLENSIEVEMIGSFFFDKYIKHEIKAMGNCGIFKRETLKKLGGIVHWNTRSYADTWMTFYLAANFDSIIYINKPMIYFRDHEGSLSSNVLSVKEWNRSQEELIIKMIELLKIKFPDKQDEYFYFILNFWCLSSFYSRMIKLKNFNLSLMYDYYLMISKYFKLLGKYRLRFTFEFSKKAVLIFPIKILRFLL